LLRKIFFDLRLKILDPLKSVNVIFNSLTVSLCLCGDIGFGLFLAGLVKPVVDGPAQALVGHSMG